MSTATASVSPQQAVTECETFLHSFVPLAKDIIVEGIEMEKEDQWIITLGFNLPSPLDGLRSPFAKSSLERDHHRQFKFDVSHGKVVSMNRN